MAVVTAAVGAAAMGVGGAMSAQAQADAAEQAAAQSQFNPFDMNGAGGSATFENGVGSVNATGNTAMMEQMFAQMFGQLGGGGAGNQGMIDFGNMMGNNMQGFFNQAQDASDPSSAVNAANMFSNFAGQNAQFGQQQGMNMMNMAQQFGTAQGGRNEGLAQEMFGFGRDALNNTDFSQLSADQLARSRARARPGEDRAVNAKFGNLFGKGILSSTGGQRQLGELALSQEMADISRMDQADRFGNMLGQQNRQFGMQAMGQGQSFRNQDDQFNAQRAQMFGGMGQGMLNFGQQSAGQAMDAQFGANNLVNSRGQQRMQNAMSMFGMGQGANQQNFQQMMGLFGGQSQINSDMRNLMAMGGNFGQMQANAGANAGQFMMQGAGSPFGSFLSGAGEGMFGAATGGMGGF